MSGTVVFAHGRESGPQGTKINFLAERAAADGWQWRSPDFRFSTEPGPRIPFLIEQAAPLPRPLVLVGSSLGGLVAAHSCSQLRPQALMLMAPALYFPGFAAEPADCPRLSTVVHGWHDDIVPVDRALRFAQSRQAELHLLDSGHTLNDQLQILGQILQRLLIRVRAEICT